MLGAIIGDIVGSRFEFNNIWTTNFELFTPECEFTDDTICTVAVADAILNNCAFEETMIKWCSKYPNPKGGYGAAFYRWLQTPDAQKQPYYSFGNGSAMRVSPCGWLYNDIQDALESARKSAAITHNHPEGIKGAVCIADLIWHANNGSNKAELKSIAVSYGYCNVGKTTCDEIRKTNVFNESCQVTVPQAIVCFLESTDFESAIRLAVSIGGDSDTIAAITSSIAEAFYGIPKNISETALNYYLPDDMLAVIEKYNKKLIHNKLKR